MCPPRLDGVGHLLEVAVEVRHRLLLDVVRPIAQLRRLGQRPKRRLASLQGLVDERGDRVVQLRVPHGPPPALVEALDPAHYPLAAPVLRVALARRFARLHRYPTFPGPTFVDASTSYEPCQGLTRSKAALAASTSASAKRRPTICRPTGRPSVNPAGTEAAGWPVKLTGYVRHHPRRGSTFSPLTFEGPRVLPSSALSKGGTARVGVTSRSYLSKRSWRASKTSVRTTSSLRCSTAPIAHPFSSSSANSGVRSSRCSPSRSTTPASLRLATISADFTPTSLIQSSDSSLWLRPSSTPTSSTCAPASSNACTASSTTERTRSSTGKMPKFEL